MNYLITGANGQLGRSFCSLFDRLGKSYVAVDLTLPQKSQSKSKQSQVVEEQETSYRYSADITDQAQMEDLITRFKPQVILNCAAYTNVDKAEKDSENAFLVNTHAVRDLALLASSHNTMLVHYSTDFVFDGLKEGFYTEEDSPNPLSVYGKSKLAGEENAMLAQKHLVFRLSWTFGFGQQNFLYKLSKWQKEKPVLKVSSNQSSVPTFTDHVAEISDQAIQWNLSGLYHLTNSGYASRYELAKYFLEKIKSPALVIPVSSSSFPLPAARPMFSAMSNKKLISELGKPIPSWQQGVDDFIKRYWPLKESM